MRSPARLHRPSRSGVNSDQSRSTRSSATKGRVHEFASYRPKVDGAVATAGDTGYGDLIEAAKRAPSSATGSLIDAVRGLPHNTKAKSSSPPPRTIDPAEVPKKEDSVGVSEPAKETHTRISKTDASPSGQRRSPTKEVRAEAKQATNDELDDASLQKSEEREGRESADKTADKEQAEKKPKERHRRAELGESLGVADPTSPQEASTSAEESQTSTALDSLADDGGQSSEPTKARTRNVAAGSGSGQLSTPALPEPSIEASDPAAEAESLEAELEQANEDAYDPIDPPEPDLPEPRDLDLRTTATSLHTDAEPTASDFSRLGLKPPANDFADEEVVADTGGSSGQLSPVELDIAQEQLSAEAAPTEYSGGAAIAGTPIPALPTPQKPELSALSPEAALSAAGGLDPGAMRNALGGVAAAVGRSVGEKRAELVANPPKLPRPSGAPLVGKATRRRKPKNASTPKKVGKVTGGAEKPTPTPKPLPAPPPPVTAKVATPTIVSTNEGGVSNSDAQRVSKALRDLPSSDAGLNATAGPPPVVALRGNADPALTEQQRVELGNTVAETHRRGAEDISQDMGERSIAPVVPDELLTASLPASEPAPQSQAAAGAGQMIDPTLSLIAKEKRSDEIDAAVSAASAKMTSKRRDHATRVREEKRQSAADISALEASNAAEQTIARTAAQVAVADARGKWSKDQETLIAAKRAEAAQAVEQAQGEIDDTTLHANEEAAKKIEAGNDKAERVRKQAERDADKKKEESEKESGGFLGWLASKAKALFEKIKAAVTAIFEFARTMIRKAIELAKKLAVEVIERARKAVVAIIETVGKVLIAIGDVLLAAFPKLRDKWRGFIEEQVESATAAVNALAEKLKTGVLEFLDALGSVLDKALGMLEKGLNAVIDRVASAVDSAIKFAESVAQALGAFTTLIGHIAGNPLGWLKNLGAGVVDGIKNHLWTALKSGIKEWFNAKLEQVVGLGSTVWTLLKEGGFSFEAVGKMVWDTLKTMIPEMLVKLLIEKLVSMIVPAAGAIMAIIEGLQAAWGAIQRIIAAFQAFFAFLKQVRDGNAGPKFATALAAAAVAVLDFVSNWLIAKLVKGAKKIGGKLKGIAKRIAKKRKAKRRKKKAARDQKKNLKGSRKGKKTKQEREKDKQRKRKERLKKAVAFVTPRVDAMLRKGTPRTLLKARLALWKVRFRIRTLRMVRMAGKASVEAANSPIVKTNTWFRDNKYDIYRLIKKLTQKYRPDDPHSRLQLNAFDDVESGKPKTITIDEGTKNKKRFTLSKDNGPYVKKYKGVKGPSYIQVLKCITTSGLSDKELGGELWSVYKYRKSLNPKLKPHAAMLSLLVFDAEGDRSNANNGISEVTARLSVYALENGLLSKEELFGSPEANKVVRQLESENKKSPADNSGTKDKSSTSNTTKNHPGKATKSKDATPLQKAKRKTGGLFYDSMVGIASVARKQAHRLTDTNETDPKEGTEARRIGEEAIERTADLVQAIVEDKEYKDLKTLKDDIIKILMDFRVPKPNI